MKKTLFVIPLLAFLASCATQPANPLHVVETRSEKEESLISVSVEDRILSSSQKIDGMLSLLYRLENKAPPPATPPVIAGHNNLDARQDPVGVPERPKLNYDPILFSKANILWLDKSSEDLLVKIAKSINYNLLINNKNKKPVLNITFEAKNMSIEDILKSLSQKMNWVEIELDMARKELLVIYK